MLFSALLSRIAPGRSASGSYAFIFLLVFWLLLALLGPLLAPHTPGEIVSAHVFSGLTSHTWLGTDYLGRDMTSRMLWGIRYTVLLCLLSTALACGVGISLGVITTISSVWVERIFGRVADSMQAVPSLMLALLVIASFGDSMAALVLTMGAIYMPGSYRTSRAMALSVAASDYVLLARARGESSRYLIQREILPNIMPPLLADIGLRFVYAVLLLSNLSFLGLGVQPPMVDLGSLVRENILGLVYGALAVVVPTLTIMALTISINLALDRLAKEETDA